jgi:4'-phosphopantetheinyl transferase EntD
LVPELVFDLALDHGRCIGIRLPDGPVDVNALGAASLLPAEFAAAESFPPIRRRSWIGGRAALREALARAGLDAPPILANDRGAPVLPSGIAASISHKEDIAVALVAREARACVGVDIEADVPGTIDISVRVLADDERADLAHLDDRSLAREVLLRFSAKEAIYKALDPFVRRYVGFTEVSTSTLPDGGVRAALRLRPGEGPFAADARWRRFDGVVLTTARVLPSE